MHTEIDSTDSKTIRASDTNVETNNAQQQGKINDQMNFEKNNDRHKKKMPENGKECQSPRRNNNNNRYNRISSNNYHNGNRQNRNNMQHHRLDTNNNSNHKMHQQNNYSQNNYNSNNSNGKFATPQNGLKSEYQELLNGNLNSNSSNNNNINQMKKQAIQKHQIVKSNNNNNNNGTNASPNYDDYTNKSRADTHQNGDKSDDSGINLNTSIINNNGTESRLKYDHLMAGDSESLNRKYSIDFLHQVGHHYKNTANTGSPQQSQQNSSAKIYDENNLIALKMALGDNSGYYNHLYSGAMYTNQLFVQTQQQQQYQQNYARYQQQQLQQRMRLFQRPENNYQRLYQQDSIVNRQQQQQQQNSLDQRSYHGYYQQQHTQQHNSFTFPNGRMKNNQNRKNRQNNNNNNHNTNSTNTYNNGSKKYNDRISHSKSDSGTQLDVNKRKNAMYIRKNSEEYRSLSPTPPSSVKSSSPGIHEKVTDPSKDDKEANNDDSESTASTHSVLSYSSDNKELPFTPTILLTPTHNNTNSNKKNNRKDSKVNSWINNNHFTPISNGMSASAEQLNVRDTPITIIKRPPSASGISLSSSVSSTASSTMARNFSLPTYDPTYPFDYYFARGEFCEMRDEPLNLSCGSAWDHVSHEIWDKFQVFQQTRETYRSKMILWRDLYEFIKGFPYFQQRACPKWGVFLVGSTISGFGLNTSDVDMCLVLKTAPQNDPRTEAMITLSALKTYLINSGSTFQGFYLINAKVPILRFRDSTNTIEVDLNYNNCIGVRNTHLLYCYSQLDWRLRPLAIIVKLWAQYHNINDARNMTISSYSLVLMVIHFLQSAVSPPVLPCLHQKYPEKFQVLHDITTIDMMERLDSDWKSENYQSLGELFLRFLDYFSNFNYSRNAISIRTGGVLSIEECRNVKTPKNEPNHWQTLCIEEPFDLTNTARSTYDGEVFEKIKNVFFQSWRLLREYKTLDSLFQEQLFVQQSASSQHNMLHNVMHTNQMLNDIKYLMYTPSPSLNSSPIISASQMNSEITS